MCPVLFYSYTLGNYLSLQLSLLFSLHSLRKASFRLPAFYCWDKIGPKVPWQGRPYLPYRSWSRSIMKGNRGRNSRQGNEKWSQSHGEMFLTGSLSWLAQFAFLTQDHLPSGGTSHSGRGPFTPTINKINVPQTCLQMLLFNGDVFSVDISSSQMTYVKSTKSTGTPGGSFVRSLKRERVMSRASLQSCWALRWAASQDQVDFTTHTVRIECTGRWELKPQLRVALSPIRWAFH